jgi:hypothetical protein
LINISKFSIIEVILRHLYIANYLIYSTWRPTSCLACHKVSEHSQSVAKASHRNSSSMKSWGPSSCYSLTQYAIYIHQRMLCHISFAQCLSFFGNLIVTSLSPSSSIVGVDEEMPFPPQKIIYIPIQVSDPN